MNFKAFYLVLQVFLRRTVVVLITMEAQKLVSAQKLKAIATFYLAKIFKI